jgi:hypothetical protein
LEFSEFVTLAAQFLVEEDAEEMQNELKEAFRLYDKEGRPRIFLFELPMSFCPNTLHLSKKKLQLQETVTSQHLFYAKFFTNWMTNLHRTIWTESSPKLTRTVQEPSILTVKLDYYIY